MSKSYNKSYYQSNHQDRDRPALIMYHRLWRRYCCQGPVLDFGCGVGYFARRLQKHAAVYGLEINDFAREQLRLNAPGVRELSATTDIPAEYFGSITALHVFEHLTDTELESAGAEIVRMLKPEGRLLAVMPNVSGVAHHLKGANWSAFKDPTHINLKNAQSWSDMFQLNWGLRVTCVFADGYYDFPYGNTPYAKTIGDATRMMRTMLQFVLARAILNKDDGENVIFVLQKSAS
jgi:SAM-dependent methyltransferase